MAVKKKIEVPVVDEAVGVESTPEKASPAPGVAQTKHEKRKLMCSSRYADDRDILYAVLDDDKQYTVTEVDALIAEYKKGKVK